jgi:anti-repressor protein
MNELIKVNYENEQPTVSGRELHEALEIGTEYTKWFERMCEYGFEESKDYSSILTNRSDGLPGKQRTDHAVTIDMAKQLCMIQRNDKGRQFREYFIAVESAWNSEEMILKRSREILEKRVKRLQTENENYKAAIEESKPKVLFADAVSASNGTILITELAKILKGNGVEIGQNRLYEQLRECGYLIKRQGSDYNTPTQRAMDLGLFKLKETVIVHSDGHTETKRTTKVTGKGQQYFINMFLRVGQI